MIFDLQNGAPQHREASAASRSRNRSLLWRVLVAGLLTGFAAVVVWRMSRLERQMAELNRQFVPVQERSNTALRLASQAETSAREAARQRDEAKAAEAQSQKAAQVAEQHATAAQAQATEAQQKAEQYRQQREAELTQLQQALSQIAETRRTAIGLILTLDSNSVRFDFDKAMVKPQYREVLSRVAGVLMTVKGYQIHVYGYTDDIGTQEYNLGLSERRAAAVRDYLVQAGVDRKIISTKGYGKADPRVSGDIPQARTANRRVEIGIVAFTVHSPVPASLER